MEKIMQEISGFTDTSNSINTFCPGCGSSGMTVFHSVRSVPAHSVLLMRTREEAENSPKRDIVLGFCPSCGFISNLAFDPGVQEYSSRYEETQGFSSTFSKFHHNLAMTLIERHELRGKEIIEIGCGKGEFLTMLCELGQNRGIGFDPAHVSERYQSDCKDRVTFIKDFYGKNYDHYYGDFVCCKMTLEHIPNTWEFVSMVRRSIGDRRDTVVFFQVPDVCRVLQELAFWDIYYEHCSYFSQGSLAGLFRNCGFDIIDTWTDYDDQYLMIEAKPGNGNGTLHPVLKDDLEEIVGRVAFFAEHINQKMNCWLSQIRSMHRLGKKTVLWGSGSKAVAFLTTLKIRNEIEFVVDINPYRQGTYMAGTGQRIVSPAFLREFNPDVVIVMNPIYSKEIKADLRNMDLNPTLLTV